LTPPVPLELLVPPVPVPLLPVPIPPPGLPGTDVPEDVPDDDPLIDEPPLLLFEALPAAKAMLLDTASTAANVSVVIFMVISFVYRLRARPERATTLRSR
jgi:hypothetical protein